MLNYAQYCYNDSMQCIWGYILHILHNIFIIFYIVVISLVIDKIIYTSERLASSMIYIEQHIISL